VTEASHLPNCAAYVKGHSLREIEVEEPDVTCSCPSFESRRMCMHLHTLIRDIATGKIFPTEFLRA
jgi:hypothetical protein